MLKLSYGTCEDTLFLDPSLELTLSLATFTSLSVLNSKFRVNIVAS